MIPNDVVLRAGMRVKFNIEELIKQGSRHFVESEKPEGKTFTIDTIDGICVWMYYSGGRGLFYRSYLDLVKRPTIILEE